MPHRRYKLNARRHPSSPQPSQFPPGCCRIALSGCVTHGHTAPNVFRSNYVRMECLQSSDGIVAGKLPGEPPLNAFTENRRDVQEILAPETLEVEAILELGKATSRECEGGIVDAAAVLDQEHPPPSGVLHAVALDAVHLLCRAKAGNNARRAGSAPPLSDASPPPSARPNHLLSDVGREGERNAIALVSVRQPLRAILAAVRLVRATLPGSRIHQGTGTVTRYP